MLVLPAYLFSKYMQNLKSSMVIETALCRNWWLHKGGRPIGQPLALFVAYSKVTVQ